MLKPLLVAISLICVTTPAVAQQAVPIVVLVKVFSAAGREDELQVLYLKRLEFLRKAEPDASFRLHRSVKEPNTFLWYEVYPSQDAYDSHLKVVMPAFRKEVGPTPDGVIAKPSESETYIELAK